MRGIARFLSKPWTVAALVFVLAAAELIFAGLSLFARFGETFGIEKTLAWCLALIVAGIALRSQARSPLPFAGERVTKADEETQAEATVFHAGSEPPVVKHFIASTSTPTKRDRFRNNRTP
jgi:hypothetical protein